MEFEHSSTASTSYSILNPQICRGKWIGWNAPAHNGYKLNTDGATRGGDCAGGGLLRDHNGDIVAWFSNLDGSNSSLYAEAQACLEGVRICLMLGITEMALESDSKQLIDMINRRTVHAWEIIYLLRHIDNIRPPSWSINHIFREQNRSADMLACMALDHRSHRVHFNSSELDQKVRHCILLNRIGVPSFRTNCK